jgi:hypothetical protein
MNQSTLEIIISATISGGAFVLNWAVRAQLQCALSAAADFVLAVVVFDAGALAASGVFENAVREPLYRENFVAIFVGLLLVSLAAWAGIFLRLENKLAECYSSSAMSHREAWKNTYFFVSWFLVSFVVAPHLYFFIDG